MTFFPSDIAFFNPVVNGQDWKFEGLYPSLYVKVVGLQGTSVFTTTSVVVLHDNELLRVNKVSLYVGGKRNRK